MQRLLAKATLFVALSALVLSAFPGSAFAVIKTMTSTRGDYWTSAINGSYGHDNTGAPVGRYRFYMGHWNPSSNGTLEVQYDNVTPGFTVTKFENVALAGSTALDFTKSASVYDTANKVWSNVEGQSDLASGHFHAPAAYPSLYKGCHWADCSAGNGGPFPIQVSQIQSLPSTWEIGVTGPAATSGVWNASYDIWFDTNARGFMPGDPKSLVYSTTNPQGGQNDGAEIMIWLNNRGYGNIDNDPATPDGNPITPAGSRIAQNISIGGKLYDVWFGRLQAPRATGQTFDNPAWNVISYVGLAPALKMENLDTNLFIQDAAARPCVGAPGNFCLKQDWWLTSIQSGFEIWADGQGLSTKAFDVIPQLKATATEQVITGRTGTGGMPIIHWELPFNLRRTGCSGGTASYLITDETGATKTGAMSEVQPGEYFASVAKVIPMHGNTTVKMTLACPGGATSTETVNVYIDPSGLVRTPQGTGIPGVTMTLFRSNSPAGPFVQVPNGSTIMAPYNRNNPDKTGTMGNFGWDVIAGYYKVRAEKAGCVSAANPAQSFVETHVMTIPPPVTDLDLRLSCPGGTLGGLPVTVTVTNDWGAGYCADVKVTNPTAATVAVWEASFAATGTIYSSWNAIFSKAGSTVTAKGQGWNAALAPGQSTHSVGFCANR